MPGFRGVIVGSSRSMNAASIALITFVDVNDFCITAESPEPAWLINANRSIPDHSGLNRRHRRPTSEGGQVYGYWVRVFPWSDARAACRPRRAPNRDRAGDLDFHRRASRRPWPALVPTSSRIREVGVRRALRMVGGLEPGQRTGEVRLLRLQRGGVGGFPHNIERERAAVLRPATYSLNPLLESRLVTSIRSVLDARAVNPSIWAMALICGARLHRNRCTLG